MEQRNNSGNLFTNDRKKSTKHPDFTGKATVGGVDYYIAGWKKKGNKGGYLSLAFTEKNEQTEQRSSNPFD